MKKPRENDSDLVRVVGPTPRPRSAVVWWSLAFLLGAVVWIALGKSACAVACSSEPSHDGTKINLKRG